MPDEEVKLGTAADKPADEPAAVEAPDMNKYYYPPGATEPVLRPDAVNTAAAPEEDQDLESKTKAELLEMADEKGVDAKQSMNKADIIELLEESE